MVEDKRSTSSSQQTITKEDLELLATPDADLRKQVEIFSFDREQFKTRISSEDRWQQLLQAHLYLDHVLTQMLLEELANPSAIHTNRMGFAQKLQLIDAMGLLPPDLLSCVEFINGIRNKIAHDLEFQISEKEEQDLKNCTPKPLREAMEASNDREPGPIQFRELLEVVLLQIDIFRQNHAFQRLTTRKAEVRLRTVLDKTEGAVYRP